MKRTFYTELSYVFGLIALALGTAMMEAADFGVSMVVAPAYLLHLKLSQTWSFVTFGIAEYLLQGVLLILMAAILRRFKVTYLLSFVTALIYGRILDGCILLIDLLPMQLLWLRILFFIVGAITSSCGVSLMFHTYLSPEVYELFVREIAAHFHLNIHRFKTGYDCASFLLGVVMSFLFFGFGVFRGIQFGTILCTLCNGFIISRWSRFFETRFRFTDRFPLRCYFEDTQQAQS